MKEYQSLDYVCKMPKQNKNILECSFFFAVLLSNQPPTLHSLPSGLTDKDNMNSDSANKAHNKVNSLSRSHIGFA